jgi:hypothetical protein
VGRKPGLSATLSLMRFHCPPIKRISPGWRLCTGVRTGLPAGLDARLGLFEEGLLDFVIPQA